MSAIVGTASYEMRSEKGPKTVRMLFGHKDVLCGVKKVDRYVKGLLGFINNDVGIVGEPQWLEALTSSGYQSRHPLLSSSSASCEHVSWYEKEHNIH
jgi:hypothetical protein